MASFPATPLRPFALRHFVEKRADRDAGSVAQRIQTLTRAQTRQQGVKPDRNLRSDEVSLRFEVLKDPFERDTADLDAPEKDVAGGLVDDRVGDLVRTHAGLAPEILDEPIYRMVNNFKAVLARCHVESIPALRNERRLDGVGEGVEDRLRQISFRRHARLDDKLLAALSLLEHDCSGTVSEDEAVHGIRPDRVVARQDRTSRDHRIAIAASFEKPSGDLHRRDHADARHVDVERSAVR